MKEKEELINCWIHAANLDMVTAEHLFQSGGYHYCLYICHLILEKLLKAVYVLKIENNPPYKHILSYLAQKAQIELSEEQLEFLEEVTDFNLEARYPDKNLNSINYVRKNIRKKTITRLRISLFG